MPPSDYPVTILAEGYKKARRSEWAEAADLCQQQLKRLDEKHHPFEKGKVAEFAGKCYFRNAFQADNNQEFRRRMHLSETAYMEATSLYQESGEEALSGRSKARSHLARFWLEQDTQRRRDVVKECIKLAREAETVIENRKDEQRLAETHLDLLTYNREFFRFSKSHEEIQHSFTEASRIGRTAIKEFESLSDEDLLFESLYSTLWMFAIEAEPILTPSDFKELANEAKGLCKKLQAISEKIGTDSARSIASMMAGHLDFILEGDSAKALLFLKEGLEASENVHDSLTIGLLSWLAAHITLWSGTSRDHTDERLAALREAWLFGSNSIRNLEISMHSSFLRVAYANQANISIGLASAQTDAEQKRGHLRTAIQLASKGVENQDHTWAWRLAAHSLGKAVYFLAVSGLESGEKTRLLNDAMAIRKEEGGVTELLLPALSWDKCVDLNYLALIKAELSSSEQDQTKKTQLLEEAVSDMQRCLEIGRSWATSGSYFTLNLAGYSEWFGDTLSRLHQLTQKKDDAERATQAYEYSAECLVASKQFSPLGPLKWKIARIYDTRGDYRTSSEQFSEAAEEYRRGAKKSLGLATTFEELAKYMAAWSKVELARLHRNQEEYMLASEKYDEASKILKETKTWNYLSEFCIARSMLERGEALSQLEKHSASVESLSFATKTFKEARTTVEGHLKENPPPLEIDELRYWLRIAEDGERYCQGRVLVEEAQLLDKKGEKSGSSRKYQSASEAFGALGKQSQNSLERVELETLAKFCLAMARMKEGESKVSPELFSQAAELFIHVKEAASKDRFRLLALANGYICKALEAGTKFRLSRDQLLYGEVKKHLETAGDYYQEAGFRKAAGWTRATQRLFDSLFCLAAAETEMDPSKKTEFYDLAEKHLESAAKLYGEAGFPGKKLEALGHLRRAREAKDVFASSIETLAEMPGASGAMLTPFSLASSQAVGLERFEEANVVGNLTVSGREVSLGSDSEIELDLANVGRTTATLIKLENIVPEGFQVEKEKNPYLWENGSVNLRGKRLDYLKTFKLKIFLKTAKVGTFELRPRISFADEKGNYRFYESWSETVTVQEPEFAARRPFALERVPPVVHIPAEFRFETERSRRIFEYLVRQFLEDYMAKRLYVEKAGWRSLMDLTRGLKLPRSAVYATGGRRGLALSELERRGLVEVRIFPQERGRGGEIARVRVSYENAIVKRLVEQIVMHGQASESSNR